MAKSSSATIQSSWDPLTAELVATYASAIEANHVTPAEAKVLFERGNTAGFLTSAREDYDNDSSGVYAPLLRRSYAAYQALSALSIGQPLSTDGAKSGNRGLGDQDLKELYQMEMSRRLKRV
ncbi:hypothetical protein P7C73_g5977, partial [Tremellales sp. Uapishka_1]